MNCPLLTLFGLLLATFALSGQQPASPPTPPGARLKIQEAEELTRRERFVDAQAKLDEAEALTPNNPQIFNLRGTIYLSRPLRDFKLAAEWFDKAEALRPGTIVVAFNQAELLFVKQDWQAAQKAFEEILRRFPKIPEQTRHLIVFKKLIAEVKLGQLDAAEKTLKDSFTFMDDTPAYYFANAALAFQRKDEPKAREWLARTEGMFKAGESAPYTDSLVEAGWLPGLNVPSANE